MPNLSLKTKMSIVVSLLAALELSLMALSAALYFEKKFKVMIAEQQTATIEIDYHLNELFLVSC